jgi:hypothetical protein
VASVRGGFGFNALFGMAFVVEEDEPANPIGAGADDG